MKRLLYLSLGLCLHLGPDGALAKGPPPAAGLTRGDLETAKRHYASGAAFFEKGDYPAARIAFEEAFRLSQLPDMLINLALVARKLDRPEEALAYLEGYVRRRPDAPDRPSVEVQIAELRAATAAAGQERERQRAAELQRQLEAEPPPAPLSLPAARRLPPLPALGLLAGGTGLLIIGIGLGGAAITTAQEVDAGSRFDRGLDAKGRALDAAGITFDVLGALTLAAGAGWTGWWYLRGRGGGHAALRPHGLGLALEGAF